MPALRHADRCCAPPATLTAHAAAARGGGRRCWRRRTSRRRQRISMRSLMRSNWLCHRAGEASTARPGPIAAPSLAGVTPVVSTVPCWAPAEGASAGNSNSNSAVVIRMMKGMAHLVMEPGATRTRGAWFLVHQRSDRPVGSRAGREQPPTACGSQHCQRPLTLPGSTIPTTKTPKGVSIVHAFAAPHARKSPGRGSGRARGVVGAGDFPAASA